MDVQLEGRSVQDLANDAENISHCHTCRPRHTTHLYDHDENLTIPLSHLGEIEIRRYAQLSIERKTNFLELSAIDLICKDELPHHLHHYMPSLGFNFILQSCSRKNRKKWFCRAIIGTSCKRFEKKQVKQSEVLDWIKLYSTARFPMLKQVKCIATVNRFLTKMLLNNYEVTEYLNFPDPILLSIEENSIISDHHAKSLRMHRCFSSCSTDCVRKRDKLRVELHLIVPHEGVTAKINFQRIYRITVNGCYWENPSLMRMELAACDLIKNENFPKQLISTLEQMGFCYSIRLDRNGDTKNDVWLIRGLYAVHQHPLRNDEVQSIELVEAMQMYESTIFTKLRKVCYSSYPHRIILFHVACPYVMMSIMDRADISAHYNLVSSSELHTIYFNKMERERAFPIRLDRHTELCKTCFRSKYHELLQTEFTMRFFMPSLDIDAPMTRIAIISSDYFERKEGSLELVYLDLIRVENILTHSVPYLPLLGFCCKIILHHDSGRRIEHVYARLLESKREMLADLNNNTVNIILGSIKMYYANFFDIFRTVKCHNKFERVVSYGLPSCKHTFAAIHNSNLDYPLENVPSYYESQHPVIDGKNCYTCNKTIGEPELKMCRRLVIRLPSISLDNEMRRYFHLYSLVDDEDEDDELLDLEVLDFLDADSICSQQIPALNALGFCCELLTIDTTTECEMKWLVRGLYGKSCKSELGSFIDYTECLDDMTMYEGRGIGDLTPVYCPQTVIFYLDRFGFDDMIVKRSSLMILEGGEKYVIPKHRK